MIDPVCLEYRPSFCLLPSFPSLPIKLPDVCSIDDKEAGGSDGDSTGAGHRRRKSRPRLPLHCSSCQKITGPPIVGKGSSDNEDSNVVECCNSTTHSRLCQASHPALVPALVDQVEHQAGESETSTSITTTGRNQSGWFRCHKCNVSRSTRRQRWWRAAARARVDYSGGEN